MKFYDRWLCFMKTNEISSKLLIEILIRWTYTFGYYIFMKVYQDLVLVIY